MTEATESDVVLGDQADALTFTLMSGDSTTGDVTLLVRLIQPGVIAQQAAHFPSGYGPDVQALNKFIQDMVTNWRGWSGVREFSTLEGEVKVAASHDGHVRLDVELLGSYPSEWRVRTLVTVEPGEQLARAGRDMDALVERSGHRRWRLRG